MRITAISGALLAGAAMALASCGKGGPDYSAAVQQVNKLFAEGMALDKTAAASADAAAACDKYRKASAKLEEAAKVMSALPTPDATRARDIGWRDASDNVTTQRTHLDSAIKKSCTT